MTEKPDEILRRVIDHFNYSDGKNPVVGRYLFIEDGTVVDSTGSTEASGRILIEQPPGNWRALTGGELAALHEMRLPHQVKRWKLDRED